MNYGLEYYNFGNDVVNTKSWKNPLIKTDDKCAYLSSAPKVIIPSDIFAKLLGMTLKIETEFTVGLMAEIVDNAWLVNGFEVPEQEVTTTSVEIIEDIACEGIYHSHVNMAASFSSTDDDYANNSHNFSIVGNKKGDLSAVAMIDLPCGVTRVVPTTVEILVADLDASMEKIKTKAITYAHSYGKKSKRVKSFRKRKEYNFETAIERWFRKNGIHSLGYDSGIDAYTGIERTYPYRSYLVYDRDTNEHDSAQWSKGDIILRVERKNGVINIEEVRKQQ